MNVYISANKWPVRLQEIKEVLEERGHNVTSSWQRSGADPMRRLNEIIKSDCVMVFPDAPGNDIFVEFGLGLALNKIMVVIGSKEHTPFFDLPIVEIYDTFDDFASAKMVGDEMQEFIDDE